MSTHLLFIALSTSFFAWFISTQESRFIYPFDATETAPKVAGENRLSVRSFTTHDKETLVIWTKAAKPGKPMIFYLPGNAGTLASRVGRFRAFLDRGYGVTALAYRGSSGSTGAPSETDITQDAFDVVEDLADAPLILYGESLGSAVAIKLAAKGYGQALVLEAPFASISQLIKHQYEGENLSQYLTQFWDSQSRIDQVKQPLMILHGAEDRLVPVAQGRALFKAAASSEKQFVEVKTAGHTDVWTKKAQSALYRFLNAF